MQRIRYFIWEPGDVVHGKDIDLNQHAPLLPREQAIVTDVGAPPDMLDHTQCAIIKRADGKQHEVWLRIYYSKARMSTARAAAFDGMHE